MHFKHGHTTHLYEGEEWAPKLAVPARDTATELRLIDQYFAAVKGSQLSSSF